MSVKTREPKYKGCISKIKDIDEKGMVVFYPSVFNTIDRVGDIVVPGAYKKTISENSDEIQHYKNHDSTQMPGVIQELSEDSVGLLTKSKLILGTQVGKDTYEQYKAMAEAGKSMRHSIGYSTVKEEFANGANYLKELYLFEASTLTKRPAHPGAVTVGVKAFDEMDFAELLIEETYYKNLLNCEFENAKLERLEELKNHITALIKSKSRATTQEIIEPQISKSELLNALNNI